MNSAAQDTLLYNLEVAENKNVLVVESRKNGFLYENEIIIDSQYFKVKNEFGSVDIGFSLNPKKGEVYVGQDRNSRVETVDAVINISSHKFKNVLVQNTWSGESSFHCKLYYARGVGLIRFDCDGSGSYEILLE
ncbi:MAG: hypothetical protein NXI10_17815 [bacterium]|nr:hypothetical protein [bacterium]